MLRDDHYQRQHVVTTAARHGFLQQLIGGIVVFRFRTTTTTV